MVFDRKIMIRVVRGRAKNSDRIVSGVVFDTLQNVVAAIVVGLARQGSSSQAYSKDLCTSCLYWMLPVGLRSKA